MLIEITCIRPMTRSATARRGRFRRSRRGYLKGVPPMAAGRVGGEARMLKVVFMPVRLIGGMVAGVLATKVSERIWALIDKEEAPTRVP